MFHLQNSPAHRSENMLCNNLSRGGRAVNCSSSGYPSDPQHLESSSVGGRTPRYNPDVLAFDMDFQMSHPVQPMFAGYYAAPSRPPQYYRPRVDISLAANMYGQFMPAQHPFDPPADFSQTFHDPMVAPQPPTPPAAPEPPATSLGPSFHYHACRWLSGPQCNGSAPGKNREMAEHLRVCHHFVGHERDIVSCEWENCGQLMQRMNVARHIVSRHLLAAANCRLCGKRFSRPDVVARHERTCLGVPSV